MSRAYNTYTHTHTKKQTVRSLYLTMFQAIGAIGVVYMIAPPTWEDLTHLAISGLVDSSNEV